MEQNKLAGIRIFFMDVDGVLTDGTIYFTEKGELMKGFNALDGAGIVYLHNAGIQTAIITARKSPAVETRARELGITYVYTGVESKLPVFTSCLKEAGLTVEEAAYIGDDLADIPPMKAASVSFAPQNCTADVRNIADIVLSSTGGQGAVRESAEMILKASGTWETVLKRYL